MKKIYGFTAAFFLMALLAGCGGSGEEESASYQNVQEVEGIVITDTLSMDAVDDSVQAISELIEIDMTAYEGDLGPIAEVYSALVESYRDVEDVICNGVLSGSVYTINIEIDSTGDAVSTLSEAGLLDVEGDTEDISFSLTCESLEESGYEALED